MAAADHLARDHRQAGAGDAGEPQTHHGAGRTGALGSLMPIRPENKARYPKNWSSEIRPAILERAKNDAGWPCCEQCGVPNGEKIARNPDGTWSHALSDE